MRKQKKDTKKMITSVLAATMVMSPIAAISVSAQESVATVISEAGLTKTFVIENDAKTASVTVVGLLKGTKLELNLSYDIPAGLTGFQIDIPIQGNLTGTPVFTRDALFPERADITSGMVGPKYTLVLGGIDLVAEPGETSGPIGKIVIDLAQEASTTVTPTVVVNQDANDEVPLNKTQDLIFELDTTAPEPVGFSVPAGTYHTAKTVELTTEPDATIYYTTDGNVPTEASTVYEGPITVDTTMTIKAIAVDEAGNISNVASADYTIDLDTDLPDPVTFSVPGGVYNSARSVELSAEEGATIYYTTDGNAPSVNSTEYTGAINVDENMTIKAIAVDEAGNVSELAEATYTILNLNIPADELAILLQLYGQVQPFANHMQTYLAANPTQQEELDELKELFSSESNSEYRNHLIQVVRDNVDLNGEVTADPDDNVTMILIDILGRVATLDNVFEIAQDFYAVDGYKDQLGEYGVDYKDALILAKDAYEELNDVVISDGEFTPTQVRQALEYAINNYQETEGKDTGFYGIDVNEIRTVFQELNAWIRDNEADENKQKMERSVEMLQEQYRAFKLGNTPEPTITVNDVTAKKQGDQVTVSGTANVSTVTIKVKKPDGTVLLTQDVQVVNGSYSFSFTLASDATIGTYTVAVNHGDVTQTDTFEVSQKTSSGGGGGGGGSAPKDNVGGKVSDAIKDAIKDGTFNPNTVNDMVKSIKEQLKGATAEEAKAALSSIVDQAKAATGQTQKDLGKVASAIAAEYVKKAAQEQLTATKENGQAKATATGAQLKSVVDKAAAALKEAKDLLAAAGVKDAALRAYLTLNVPDAAEDTVVNFSISDLQSAISGLDNDSTDLRVVTDGVAVSINVSDILQALTAKASVVAAAENDDYSIQVVKSGAVQASAGLQSIAGVDAVELKVTSKDKAVTRFNTPVSVEIEVGNLPKGTDLEKVLVYKLVEDKWIAVGGAYEDGVMTFTAKEVGKYSVFVSTKTFTDLGSVSWAQKQIEVMAAKGIVTGRSDTKFAPHANVTRAEFASLIVRALGLYDNNAAAEFKDVKSSDWFSASVGSAVKAGIVKGVSADQFKPNATITRQEMATMLANALKLSVVYPVNVDESLASFSDKNNIQSWAKESVALSAQHKLIQGMPNGTFAPSDKATRAQAAVVIYNLTKLQ